MCYLTYKTRNVLTYVSTPDVRGKDLISFIEVQDLDQANAKVDADCDRSVVDWATDNAILFVPPQQILYQKLLI